MEVSKADFARMAGVAKPAISSKIKHGTLVVNTAGRLDTENPVNRMYLDRHQQKMRSIGLNPPPFAEPFAAPSALTAQAALPSLGAAAPEPAQPAPDSAASAQAAPPMPAEPTACPGVPPASAPAQASPRTTPPKPKPFAAQSAASPSVRQSADEMLGMTLRQLIQAYGNLDGIERYVKILRDLSSADEKAQRIQERRQMQIPKDFVVSRLFGFINQLANKLLDTPEAMVDHIIALAQIQSPCATPPSPPPQVQTPEAASPSVTDLAQQALDVGGESEIAAAPAEFSADSTVEPTETAAAEPRAADSASESAAPEAAPAPAESAEETRRKIVLYIRDNLSRCIGGAKEGVINELQALRLKYADENETQTQIQDIYEALNEQ